jgi:hypothetical protein
MVDSRKPSKPGGRGASPAASGKRGKDTPASATGKRKDTPAPGKAAPVAGRQAAGPAARSGRQPQPGKLARGAAARREAERQRRRRTVLYSVAAGGVLLVLIAVVVWAGRPSKPAAAPSTVAAGKLAQAEQAARCTAVQTFPQAGRDHIPPSQQPRNWNSNPPTSGDHLGTPLPRGIYQADQDERALVHNLEHGYVVIQYKGISDAQLRQLTDLVKRYDGQKVILAPWSGLPSNGVFTTAWQRLQGCQQFNTDVVNAFIAGYMVPVGTQSVAPEPEAA